MSNYHRNFSNFPRHASLPAIPSRTHSNGQRNGQNVPAQVLNPVPHNTQAHPFPEPLPDILAFPLDSDLRQPTQNIQERVPINNAHTIQDHTQHFLAPQQERNIQFEINAQQPLQNTQPQYPTLSSNPIENRDHPLFKPLPDILTSFNSHAQDSSQRSLGNNNMQQRVPFPTSASLQTYPEPMVSLPPDILMPLESPSIQPLPPDMLLQTSIPPVLDPTQLSHNQDTQQFIRRTVSKPAIPTKKSSKTKPRSKKLLRGSASSHKTQAQFQLPLQFKEHTRNPNPQPAPAGLPRVMRNKSFKKSLQSVLARTRKPHSASVPTRTQSTMQPRFPDREEAHAIAVPTARYPNRDPRKSNAAQGIRNDQGMPSMQGTEMMQASVLAPQGLLPMNQSIPNLQQPSNQRNFNPPELTIRKRPASCSALPARRSSKEMTKKNRPCDSVDQAVAEGRELTKEQIRVLRNRQHAFNSRERTKSKRRQYDEENAMLRERITHLENENEQLRTTRNALLETAPEHLKLQIQMMDNQQQENGSQAE